MDNFDKISLVMLIIAVAIGETLYFILRKKYKKQGKSIKHLECKIFLVVVLPIVSIPFLITPVIPLWAKLGGVALGCIVGFFYLYSIAAARKAFRKIFGLSPEDEHTGDVIKGDRKEK